MQIAGARLRCGANLKRKAALKAAGISSEWHRLNLRVPHQIAAVAIGIVSLSATFRRAPRPPAPAYWNRWVTDHRVSGIRDSIFEKPREIRRCPVEIGAHRIDQDIEGGLPA